MSYHMPRVMHWIQNQNVDFYPTSTTRQLYVSPFSEYVILHLQLIVNGDRLANLVQWFSMFGSLIGVSLIAREFRFNPNFLKDKGYISRDGYLIETMSV